MTLAFTPSGALISRPRIEAGALHTTATSTTAPRVDARHQPKTGRPCRTCGEAFRPQKFGSQDTDQRYCSYVCGVAPRLRRRLASARYGRCAGCQGRFGDPVWWVYALMTGAYTGYLACDECLQTWRRFGRAKDAIAIEDILTPKAA